MKFVLLIAWMFLVALVAHAAEPPLLHVYIVSKEPGQGLHQVDFPAFPKLGYVADKPDLTISQLEGVSFGKFPGMPKRDGGYEKPTENRRSLELKLTRQDGQALTKLTSAHIGARLLLLLNDDPLVAPEIKTPSLGQLMYITAPPGVDTEKVKAKLETLIQKPKQV